MNSAAVWVLKMIVEEGDRARTSSRTSSGAHLDLLVRLGGAAAAARALVRSSPLLRTRARRRLALYRIAGGRERINWPPHRRARGR